MEYAKRTLYYMSLVLLLLLIIPNAGASSQPTLTIASNPVNYGHFDKITASTNYYIQDLVQLYINNKLVAGPKKYQLNYTICSSGACLVPGTYAITAYDNQTGASTVQNLVVSPVSPTFSVQYSSAVYGKVNTVTAYPAFYNDSMTIIIDGSYVASGSGVIVYNICGSPPNGGQCLSFGNHTVTVYDNTEGVYASSNKTITVQSTVPSIQIQKTSVRYGLKDTINATAPIKTDSISIIINSSQVASGTGTVSYTICGSTSQPCIAPGTYSVRAYDSSEHENSSRISLTITPALPQLSLSSGQIAYGNSTQIYARATNANDPISISIDGRIVSSSIGNTSYTVCSILRNTPCVPAGEHIISAYDSIEKLSTNSTLTVTPIRPIISLSAFKLSFGVPDTIGGQPPYYNDQMSILINRVKFKNGTGSLSYTICSFPHSSSCLAPGNYSVYVEDISEGVNSLVLNLLILPNRTASSSTISIITTTTISSSSSTKTTTATQKSSTATGGISNTDLEIIGVVIAIIIIASIALRLRKPKEEPSTALAETEKY